MLVNLKRQWFAPDGARYRVRDNPHKIPDEWKKLLPPDAEETSDPDYPDYPEAETPKRKPKDKKDEDEG